MLEIKILTVGDKIVIATLLILCFISAAIVFIIRSGDNKRIVINVAGKKVKEISLNNKNTNKIYEFKFKENIGYIEVKDGSVRMLEMDREICPEKICSDTGWIKNGYESIVCLPNKIIVSIENSDKGLVDEISQ